MSIKKDLIKINIMKKLPRYAKCCYATFSVANLASQSKNLSSIGSSTRTRNACFASEASSRVNFANESSFATLIPKVNVRSFKRKASNLDLYNMSYNHRVIIGWRTYNVCSSTMDLQSKSRLKRISSISSSTKLIYFPIRSISIINLHNKLKFNNNSLDLCYKSKLNNMPLAYHSTTKSYSTNKGSLEIIMIFACAILSINIILLTLDMLTLYISIELFSFTSFFLILITPAKLASGVEHAEQSVVNSSDSPGTTVTTAVTSNATVNAFIYFIFNTISSIIILIYFLLIYKNFGFLNFSNFSISQSSLRDSTILSLIINSFLESKASFAGQESWLSYWTNLYISGNLFFLGFLLKLGLSPFHFWIISLYDSISPKITFYISTIPKILYFFIILKFIYIFNISFSDTFFHSQSEASQAGPIIENTHLASASQVSINIFIIFIILSLIFGSFLGINNKRIIKLFASSSITNTGFILLYIISSLCGVAINNSTNYGNTMWGQVESDTFFNFSDFYTYSVYHYIILYMINIYNFFYILLNFYNFNHIYILKDFKWSFPFLSFIFFISILSFIGIPPLSGFFNKFYLFINCILSFNIIIYVLLFLSIIISIINTNFYLFFIKFLLGKRSVNYKYTSLFRINKNNKYPKLNQLPLTISFIFIAFYPLFSYNFFNIINLFIY